MWRLLLLLLVVCAADVVRAGEGPPEPPDYRMDNYRQPVPRSLQGARVVETAEAEALWKQGAVFVDVMPQVPRPANLPAGTIWRDPPHRNIPGSLWLADTGYGALAPVTEKYLTDGLARATSGDRSKMIVVYCQRDCWMSWNAAKRILTLGYANVVWYPDGTDGWQEADLPLRLDKPVPPQAN